MLNLLAFHIIYGIISIYYKFHRTFYTLTDWNFPVGFFYSKKSVQFGHRETKKIYEYESIRKLLTSYKTYILFVEEWKGDIDEKYQRVFTGSSSDDQN